MNGSDDRDPGTAHPVTGWSSVPVRHPRRERPTRRLVAFLLMLPLVLGLFGSPAGTQVARGDELSDAKAKQEQLKKEVAAQKARVAAINDLQAGLAAEIRSTKSDLKAIGADLTAVKKKITGMEAKIKEVQAAYDSLVLQVRAMDAELGRVTAQEIAKRQELSERRALLAERVRNAYDTDRTSPLETFLSGGTFTDLLAEMSYYIDVGEQDKALASQITKDRETLATVHQLVADTRARTNDLRQETAAQKVLLDRSLIALQETKAQLRKLEKQVAKALKEQQARYAALLRNKANAAAIIRKAAADQKRLARKIDALIEKQVARGNIPSEFNGTMRWPMDDFRISGEYGCSSYAYYAPGNGCENYHNGIDLVAPYGTPVKAAAGGTVVYVGWNWADGSDPAWIVVIAHSSDLRTWYAHMQPERPVSVGQTVRKGQIIGYEGSTGKSTGAHLHWMVEYNGSFRNPRLFL
ncbi:MAG: murein hydrolase activator EnvC family protein [Candidatus Limnocylindrales bacterium]